MRPDGARRTQTVVNTDREGFEEAMDGRNDLGQRFEASRARLRAVAYRMLGSLSDADDAVQEAWLR